ncbi:WYL domain-containing protein [Roseimicrobium gellanilyticum]|uniref:WYL domain-containing protein n=1 Tax=Roseimicrobium gellanilyticum TaxID=748857 RepID=UPI000DEBE40C
MTRWILSWGQHVQVMEPVELRERIQNEVQLMAQRHSVQPHALAMDLSPSS